MQVECAASCRACHALAAAQRVAMFGTGLGGKGMATLGHFSDVRSSVTSRPPRNGRVWRAEPRALSCSGTGACAPPANATPAVPPGTITPLFHRMATNFPELEPQLLSLDPPVLVFDAFTRDEEVEALIRHADGQRFEPAEVFSGNTEIRKADRWACDEFSRCLADPLVQRLSRRATDLAGVPTDNTDFLQLVRYRACPHDSHPDCQYFRRHHDTVPTLLGTPSGPRVLTFMLYLSDVEEGGGTLFNELGITVSPKKGRVVVWPSTRDERPFERDELTHHEALPVTRGVKLIANLWVHQYEFRNAYQKGRFQACMASVIQQREHTGKKTAAVQSV